MNIRKIPSWHFFLLFLRQFYREPATLFWSFGFPLLAALLIAPAMSNDGKTRFRVGVEATATISPPLALGLHNDPLLIPVKVTISTSDFDQQNLSRVFMRNSLDALITEKGLFLPEGGNGGVLIERLLLTTGTPQQKNGIQTTRVHLMGQRFLDWFVPGLLGLGLLSSGLFFVAVRVVLERSAGFFKRLKLSPFKRRSYLLGFSSAYALLCVLQTSLLSLAFYLSADFRIQGNIWEFILWGTFGGVVFGLLGLAIAATVKSVPVVSGIANIFYFPMMFLCGVYFRTEYFPAFIQPFIKALPLSALNNGLRAIANGGVSVFSLTQEILILCCWAVICLLFVARFFDWGKE